MIYYDITHGKKENSVKYFPSVIYFPVICVHQFSKK